jgi:hypothetical protein
MNPTTKAENSPQLRLVYGSGKTPEEENQFHLEEDRQRLDEFAAAENYWAGHNLANRNSARKAA